MKYTPIIGIEVHVELGTLSKMFCGCDAKHFNIKPNTHTCPICLGLPGALPVPNEKAIYWTLVIGHALACTIAKESKFDRKHYFYPDLPKGYQISQHDKPFCIDGFLKLSDGKKVDITRVHLEEDTGKLIHATVKGKPVSLVDFNRSGVPLVEIVSEPDINSSTEAKDYVKKIQQIVRYLGVSDCDMEKGSMRLEANISLTSDGSLPSYKVEVKNLNSFRFFKEAIDYEIVRQAAILDSGKPPTQETRGWQEDKRKTLPQRTKEAAQDYRYFPEPDIPPITPDMKKFKKIWTDLMTELPDKKIDRFVNKLKISRQTAEVLTSTKELATYFEETVRIGKKHNIDAKQLANIIANKKLDIDKYSPDKFVKILVNQQSSSIKDEKILTIWVDQVIEENPQAVVDFKNGKTSVLGFLIGQIQRQAKGKADIGTIRELLINSLPKQNHT